MAQFKTAYSQRMIPFDVAVVGSVAEGVAITSSNRKAAILYGDFVKLVPASATVVAYITKATQAEVDAHTATHIVALTDMTLGSGHVPTDLKDYRSSDLVGATSSTNPETLTAAVKKVGLYPIYEWDDIYQDADQLDAAVNASEGGGK